MIRFILILYACQVTGRIILRYLAMDFETGNHKYTSACALGLSYYEDHEFISSKSFLIRPPDDIGNFHWYNVKIHGIEQSQLVDAPTFDCVWSQIADSVNHSLIVCHNAAFDTQVLCQCLEYYGLTLPTCSYLCTVKVAKKVWPELENHKLNTVAQALGISLNHHQAESDARACGEILQAALKKTHTPNAVILAKQFNIQLGMISPNEHHKHSYLCKNKKRKEDSL